MLFTRVKVSDSAPAFYFSPGIFITYKSFPDGLKSLLNKCDMDPAKFSRHSFRRGGASYLHSLGGTGLQIQASGDW